MDAAEFLKLLNEKCSGLSFNKDNIVALLDYVKLKASQCGIQTFNENHLCLDNKNTTRLRFSLIADRMHSNFAVKLVKQANGLLYQFVQSGNTVKCELLVVPPNEFNNNFKKTDVEQSLKENKYKIYAINDGTSFNMYFDDTTGTWKYTTKNSYDVGDLIWRGYSYQTVITDTFKQYKDFSIDKLNKKCCYSFGFKHPAYHLFKQPDVWNPETQEFKDWIKKAWVITAYNKETNKYFEPAIGIPEQKILSVKNLQVSKCIYASIIAQCNEATKVYLNTSKAFLGYILRMDDGEFSDILFESSLYKDIKYCIYNKTQVKNPQLRIKLKEDFKNLNYVVMDAYLNYYKREVFIKLFPQFKSYYEKFDNLIQESVNKIYNEMRGIKSTPENDKIDALVKYFLPIFQKNYQIKLTKPEEQPKYVAKIPSLQTKSEPRYPVYYHDIKQTLIDKKMLRNIIQHPKNIDIFMAIVFT
jgi:hypothetical protein